VIPAAVAAAVTSRTAAILPVHLYGQAADMPAMAQVAERHGLAIVEDCCQAHLATGHGRPVGTGNGAFSFYPTKNLGAVGDGGAVTTDDAAIAERIRRLRNGGQTDRYHHEEAGVNSRLDEMQAAVLRARLPRLRGWTARRRQLAALYRSTLPAALPLPERDAGHVYHLFPIRSGDRDALQTHLQHDGIQTLIHYRVPLPHQRAFEGCASGDTPVAARAAREILSLPLYPRLTEDDVRRVANAVAAFEKGRAFA